MSQCIFYMAFIIGKYIEKCTGRDKDKGLTRITLTGYVSKRGSRDKRGSHDRRVEREDWQLFLQGLSAEHPAERVAMVQREQLLDGG